MLYIWNFAEVSGPLDELDFALPLIEDFIAENRAELIDQLAREVDPAFEGGVVTTEEYDPAEVSVSSFLAGPPRDDILCMTCLGVPLLISISVLLATTSGAYIHYQSSCHCHTR